ncbi:hypothetical protein MOO45_07070 [Bombilactobacillus folatiphilus]|uniref:Uncharacterized protein n=1 Tax=Bombilactobacillus folatiphilus TaxID=2923362 RepID=A0ABY4P8B3_9LACO|nr:hypothetical protein [Bombilactobacillus folatiphilus]UQS81943.1 hypothetical protein MOO45_07070 [Bombilactobacillus folatiphilus]
MSLFNKQHSNKNSAPQNPQEQQMNGNGVGQQTQQMPVQDPNNYAGAGQQTQQMPVQDPNNYAGAGQQTQQMPVQDPNNYAGANQQPQQMPVQDPNNNGASNDYFQDVEEYPVQNDKNLYRSSNFNQPDVEVSEMNDSSTQETNSDWDQWRQTETKLLNLNSEQGQLKRLLKGQLLTSRTYYNQSVQRKQESSEPYKQNVSGDLQQIKQINDSLKKWFGTDAISGEVMFEAGRNYLVVGDKLADPNDAASDALADLNYFLDSFHILPNLVTLNFDEELEANWQDYLEAGVVNPETQLLNLFQYFQLEDNAQSTAQRSGMGIEISPHAVVKTDSERNVDHIYERDSLVMKVIKDDQGNPANIYHYCHNNLFTLDYLDAAGNNLITQFYDPNTSQKLLRKHYYRLDGTLAIIESTQETEPQVQVFNHNNLLVQSFNSEADFEAWWLINKVVNPETTVIIPLESPICNVLLEYPDADYQVLPYIDDVEKRSVEITRLLPLADRLSAGVLVTSTNDQARVSQLTKGKVNVSVIPSADAQE